MLRVAICGLGRAAAELIRTIIEQGNDVRVAAGFCRINSERKGKDLGELAKVNSLGIEAREVSEAAKVFAQEKIDVVIDFSSPKATRALLPACKKFGIPAVICTTGFSEKDLLWLKNIVFDKSFGLLYAPNVTIGINVLIAALKTIVKALPYYDYQIIETHHNKKTDIPSGTAKILSDAIKNELQVDMDHNVQINSVRAGGYIGVHEVIAAGDNERLKIEHQSFSRRAFSEGALRAARFIYGKKGWFEMSDVINASPPTA